VPYLYFLEELIWATADLSTEMVTVVSRSIFVAVAPTLDSVLEATTEARDVNLK